MERGRSARSEERTAEARSKGGGAALRPPPYGVKFVDEGPVQAAERGPAPGQSPDVVAGIAARGFTGSAGALPHLDVVQRAFGRHDLSQVRAYTGAAAASSAAAIGARAYTVGDQVAFRGRPSLHTAAHEAAHVIQQAAGVHLDGGVGQVGDRYEVHADAVADAVVQGASAEPLLDTFVAGQGGGETGVQRAVGFEFQTGWGLVRSLKEHPREPVQDRVAKPDPEKQGDWEDVEVEHRTEAPKKPAPTRGDWSPRFSPVIPKEGYRYTKELTRPSATTYTDESSGLIAHPTKGRKHYKFHKGQVLKDYDGFKMTVDDASTRLGAELEWVIDPPIEESRDPKDVTMLFDRLHKVCMKLLAFKRRESFLLSEVTGARSDDHIEFQPNVKGPGAQGMLAAPQATGGVSVDRLFRLFEHLSGQRTVGEFVDAKNNLSTNNGTPAVQSMVKRITKIPSFSILSDRLKGLLAFIVRYVEMASGDYAVSYAKVNTQFLARTDFATMFRLLPETERKWLEEDPGELFTLVAQAFGNKLDESRKVFVGGIKQPGRDNATPPLTVGEWIRGIAGGKDLLSGQHWKRQVEGGGGQEASMYKDLLESMGSLGDKTDKIGVSRQQRGIVMEFRSRTESIPVEQWGPYALSIFTYLKALNRNQL